jgi:hypothetical protein
LTVPVRLKGVRIERSRRFGDVDLALALWRGTALAELFEQLLPSGKEAVPWPKMAAVLVAARLCEPSSELHIAEDWYRRTALSDLLQLDADLVNKDRLYRALDLVLEHKADLEAHLSRRCGAPKAELRKFTAEFATAGGWPAIRDGIEVKLARWPDTGETAILCRSADRRTKEQATHDKFSRRIDAALARLGARIDSSTKRLNAAQANRQIGRILQRNQRSAARFQITLQAADCPAGFHLQVDHNGAFDEWAVLSEGAYVLRTNIADWSAEQLWKASSSPRPKPPSASTRISGTCVRSGISAKIGCWPTSWSASSPSCCGRASRCGSSAPVWATPRARCSKSSPASNRTMSSSPRQHTARSGCAASPSPTTPRRSSSIASVSSCPGACVPTTLSCRSRSALEPTPEPKM